MQKLVVVYVVFEKYDLKRLNAIKFFQKLSHSRKISKQNVYNLKIIIFFWFKLKKNLETMK